MWLCIIFCLSGILGPMTHFENDNSRFIMDSADHIWTKSHLPDEKRTAQEEFGPDSNSSEGSSNLRARVL